VLFIGTAGYTQATKKMREAPPASCRKVRAAWL